MLTLFTFLEFMSLHEEEDVTDYFGARPKKAPRHRAEPDYTLTFGHVDESLDVSEPRRATWLERLHAMLFR